MLKDEQKKNKYATQRFGLQAAETLMFYLDNNKFHPVLFAKT